MFSAAVRAMAVIATLVILATLLLTSFILALGLALVAKLVISGILSSIFLILVIYTSFSTTSCFTTSLSLLKSTAAGSNLPTLFYLLYFWNCLNYFVHFLIYQYFYSSISNLSTSDYRLARSTFLANFVVSIHAAFFKSAFVT